MSYIYWDPAREMLPFNLPLLGRPILWYGFFFALGFFLGYWVLVYLLKDRKEPRRDAERITLYVIVGTLVGARLADVLFYQSPALYLHDPLMIIKVWEGGLASHGGAVGALLSLALLAPKIKIRWISLVDLVVIPAALGGALIRIGNFFNQEILGTITNVPWAVVFGHPMDGTAPVPRHPVQLYESLFYFVLFFVLFFLWRAKPSLRKPGKMSGLFFISVFTFRFFIEFFKTEQSELLRSGALLDMGQWLSLPLIALGFYLFFCDKAKARMLNR